MNEVSFLAGEADAGLRDRLDEELSAFNAATMTADEVVRFYGEGSGCPSSAASPVMPATGASCWGCPA